MSFIRHVHDTPEALATALADEIANVLATAVNEDGKASLAVSGGSTPVRLFEALSEKDLDWSRIHVTLVDDRQVPANHERSNEGLVRRHLMQNWAAQARFTPLIDTSDDALDPLLPLDVCILGMGADGHTASFFPGGDTLANVTNPQQLRRIMAIEAPGAEEPRITLTLPVIAAARHLILHIEGADKDAVLKNALRKGDLDALPVRHVLAARPDIIVHQTL